MPKLPSVGPLLDPSDEQTNVADGAFEAMKKWLDDLAGEKKPGERAEDVDSAAGLRWRLKGQKSDRNCSAQQRTDGKCH